MLPHKYFVAAAFVIIFLSFTISARQTEDTICNNDGYCYSKIFSPTNEFQDILEGQEVPPGLHVRVNMHTGRKQAKLIDETSKNEEYTDIVILDEDGRPIIATEEVAPENIKVNFHTESNGPPPATSSNFSSSPFLTTSNKRIPYSDHLIFDEHIAILTRTDSTTKDLVLALDGLEDLVHEFDFGVKLAKGDGLLIVVELLGHFVLEVKQKAAMVLGTAMQNNPIAQNVATQLNLVERLLDNLTSERNVTLLSRLLYALSSIVRGNKDAIQSLHNSQGLLRLADFYASSNDELRAKCAILVTDFFDPNMADVENNNNGFFDQQQQWENDYDTFRGGAAVAEWCRQFQDTLFDLLTGDTKDVSFDVREKVLGGLAMIKKQYPSECLPASGLKTWLKNQHDEVKDQDDFEDYYRLIQNVRSESG